MNTLLWYFEIAWDYVRQMLPCALVSAVVFFCVHPLRRRRLAERGLKSGRCREAGLLVFVFFCAGLAGLTLFPANFWSVSHWRAVLAGYETLFQPIDWHIQLQTIQLIPLRTISGASGGAWKFFMLLGNAAMFLPLGFFPALLWHRERLRRSLLVGLGTSAGIEFIQFFVGRSSDVDDMIINTLGALAGYGVFCVLRRLSPGLIEKFRYVKVESLRG